MKATSVRGIAGEETASSAASVPAEDPAGIADPASCYKRLTDPGRISPVRPALFRIAYGPWAECCRHDVARRHRPEASRRGVRRAAGHAPAGAAGRRLRKHPDGDGSPDLVVV